MSNVEQSNLVKYHSRAKHVSVLLLNILGFPPGVHASDAENESSCKMHWLLMLADSCNFPQFHLLKARSDLFGSITNNNVYHCSNNMRFLIEIYKVNI